MPIESDRELRILIIDDNKDFATILCTLFEFLGHTAATADNGIEGLEKAKQIKPDVIFCDIGLPGMNGYEVAESIRKDDALKEVPLIALTGYAGDREKEMAKKSGFTMHIAKPVDLPELKKILAQIS